MVIHNIFLNSNTYQIFKIPLNLQIYYLKNLLYYNVLKELTLKYEIYIISEKNIKMLGCSRKRPNDIIFGK